MKLKRRPARSVGVGELLDEPGHGRAAHERSLDAVAAVNRWLGGDRAIWHAIRDRLRDRPRGARVRLLDVGTGAAAQPLALAKRLRRAGREPVIAALDLHPEAVRIAASRSSDEPAVRVLRGDALALPFRDASFDFAMTTLTLHHFEGPAQVAALRELARVARTVVVDELERGWPNYVGARLLAATVWRNDPITRSDGPLSVLRAFTSSELLDVAREAGLGQPRVERHFFFRLLLVAGGA